MTSRNSIWWKLPGVVIWMIAVGLLAMGYTSGAGLLFALLGVVARSCWPAPWRTSPSV